MGADNCQNQDKRTQVPHQYKKPGRTGRSLTVATSLQTQVRKNTRNREVAKEPPGLVQMSLRTILLAFDARAAKKYKYSAILNLG